MIIKEVESFLNHVEKYLNTRDIEKRNRALDYFNKESRNISIQIENLRKAHYMTMGVESRYLKEIDRIRDAFHGKLNSICGGEDWEDFIRKTNDEIKSKNHEYALIKLNNLLSKCKNYCGNIISFENKSSNPKVIDGIIIGEKGKVSLKSFLTKSKHIRVKIFPI